MGLLTDSEAESLALKKGLAELHYSGTVPAVLVSVLSISYLIYFLGLTQKTLYSTALASNKSNYFLV